MMPPGFAGRSSRWSCRTPSRLAAQLASFARAAASSAPAGICAKSRTPLAPSVAITKMGFASLPRQMINLVCYGGAFVGSA